MSLLRVQRPGLQPHVVSDSIAPTSEVQDNVPVDLIEQYWSGVQRRLQAEVDGFNRLISHQGEKGRENELSLARLLASLVPARYGVGSGLIFDSQGAESSQSDIVLFNAIDEPAILAQTNQVLFPVENVRGVIEVKTSAGKTEVEDIGVKVASVRSLNPAIGDLPLYAAVGYNATVSAATLAGHLRALKTPDGDRRPDLFLVLDLAMLGVSGDLARGLGWDLADDVDYLIGVAPLHTNPGRDRVSGEFLEPPDLYSKTTVVNGSTYSVHTAKGHGDYVAESSRALLLFSEALLTALAQADGRPAPGIHHYITPMMRDLLPL